MVGLVVPAVVSRNITLLKHASLRTIAVLLAALSVIVSPASGQAAAQGRARVGLQLHSVKDSLSSDLEAALAQVRAWGIVEVETAGMAGLPAIEYAARLKAHQLKAVSAHFRFDRLEKNLTEAIADAAALGVEYAICPILPGGDKFDDAAARVAAEKFNRWGREFAKSGIMFGYHTHGMEFQASSLGSSLTPFDVLVQETDPKLVCFEMDVFWVYRAGIDPVALLRKYPDRWTLLHIKDARRGSPRGPILPRASPADRVVVGQGEIDWPVLFQTAKRVGIAHFFIEDESLTPMDNVPASLQWLDQHNLP